MHPFPHRALASTQSLCPAYRPPRRLPKALALDELEALQAIPMNLRDRALIAVMSRCGLRVSEACDLTVDNVHWTSETPHLRFTGKRGKERVVPMNLEVQDALRLWLEARPHADSPYIFCNLQTGGRLNRKTVWASLKRYAQKAGIRHIHPHMLRHTFGTDLADRDVPVERIRAGRDSLSDMTASSGRLLDKLNRKFVIMAAIQEVRKNREKHFWKFDQIEIENLPQQDAKKLIRQCATGADIDDYRMTETYVLQQSAGNPRAIVEIVDRLRKEPAITRNAVRDVSHTRARHQIDLTIAVVLVAMVLIAIKFIARGFGTTDVYVLAGVGSAVLLGIRFYLMRFR